MKHFWNSNRKSIAAEKLATTPYEGTGTSKRKRWLMLGAVGVLGVLAATAFPLVALASVESSLQAVQAKLVGTILPLAAICGLVIAAFSFVAGHPNARSHLTLAIMGAVVGFGAESIVSLIRSLIQ